MTTVASRPLLLDVLPRSPLRDLVMDSAPRAEPGDSRPPLAADQGFEPRIGEIHGLRSFRVSSDGLLRSLSTGDVWTAGTNTASCRYDHRGADRARIHPAPQVDCSCGFYACVGIREVTRFGSAPAVLASVACWGRVVADSGGVRAEHARIEAIWLSRRVDRRTSAAVRARYPAATIYRHGSDLMMNHPPTRLTGAHPSRRCRAGTPVTLARSIIVAGLVLGGLPSHWILAHPAVLALWALALTLSAGAAVALARRRGDYDAAGLRLTLIALCFWMVAPFAGPIGMWLFRLPMLEIALLSSLRPRRAG